MKNYWDDPDVNFFNLMIIVGGFFFFVVLVLLPWIIGWSYIISHIRFTGLN